MSDITDTPCLQLTQDISVWHHQCSLSTADGTSVSGIINAPWQQLIGHRCLTSLTLLAYSLHRTSVSDIINAPCLQLMGHQCLTSSTLPVYSWQHPQTDLILGNVKGRSQADEFGPQAVLHRGLAAGKEGLRCLPLNIRVDGVRFAKLLKAETAHQCNQCQTAQSWNNTLVQSVPNCSKLKQHISAINARLVTAKHINAVNAKLLKAETAH